MIVQHPEYVWHGPQERILSIDFHPFTNQLITGGSDEVLGGEATQFDGYAKAWEYEATPEIKITFKFGLKKHTNNVGVVKYSPDARYIATGSDDHSIVVWEMRENFVSVVSKEKKLMWCPRYELRGHYGEIADLKWSPDGKYIISAGFDKRIFIWNYVKSQYVKILEEHKKPIQGLAVDPSFQYIVSQGTDRLVKVWMNAKTKKDDTAFSRFATLDKADVVDLRGADDVEEGDLSQEQQNQSEDKGVNVPTKKKFVKAEMENLQRKSLNTPEDDLQRQDPNKFKMFFDEHIPTFFRRPDISPDGELFLLVGAQWKESEEYIYCSLLYRKKYLETPTAIIKCGDEASLCARFCPKLFKKNAPETGLMDDPYYMVFAIGTFNSVYVYSTEKFDLLYSYGNHHYASITEVAWKDDRILGVSSNDRTCSFMVFENGELGQVYEADDNPELKAMITRLPYQPSQRLVQKSPLKLVEQSGGKPGETEVEQPLIRLSEMDRGVSRPEQEDPNRMSEKGPETLKPQLNVTVQNGRKRIVPKMIQKFD